ncbi:MAG: glycosyltransferase [Deltaproteobacteria bacterium]|nr:glycosyltransferase [Deltaproteobacteria bacterium]
MKVLMLGWEYPPHISGGLGTACEGLTVGLARQDVEILFVVPSLFGGERASHMQLVDARGNGARASGASSKAAQRNSTTQKKRTRGAARLKTVRIPAFLSPYLNEKTYQQAVGTAGFGAKGVTSIFDLATESAKISNFLEEHDSNESFVRYGTDIFGEVARYTAQVVSQLADEQFDVIHAHDWMTYPAAVALSQLSGKPLIVHVHSLEYDRSGESINHQINDIEHFGLHAAQAVIGVSYYTRSIIHERHGVPLDKIHVVHNGVYPKKLVQRYRARRKAPSKMVLFLGRITFQKGPDYFVEAAAKVIPHVPDVSFVMAGSGDMLPRMIERVHELGISSHFEFPGFLKGPEVEEMFSLADVYVMPSVSEPFGIAALEAISFDTPVIISRQSGVAEVLGHALKVDFWDLNRLADLMINSLLHDELRQDIASMAREELKRLRWDVAALRTKELYQKMV